MQRKSFLILIMCFFAVVLLAGNVFAKNGQGNGKSGLNGNGIVDIYMTHEDSFEEYDTFCENDTPWLYLKVKDSVTKVTGDWWFWNKGNQSSLLSFDTSNFDMDLWSMKDVPDNSDDTRNIWLSRLDLENVTAHDQWWHVTNVHSSSPNGGGATKYHVTPEPVSSMLFLVGAGAFAVASRRRKKEEN